MSVNLRIVDMPEFQTWSTKLSGLGKQPLQRCPHFPVIARRFNAWWQGGMVDRPLWLASANMNPARPITRRIDLLEHPAQWLECKLKDLEQTAWFGDAVPNARADLGASCLGSLIGAPVECSSDTTWTHACIHADDWSDAPDLTLKTDGKWWKILQSSLDAIAEAARGKFLVCTPSLGGLADVLTNLRGATEICMDLLDHPERVEAAFDTLHEAWVVGFCELYRRILAKDAGLIHWHLLWSDVPYVVAECDLAFSIGPAEFQRICVPDIARTVGTVGRGVFHLDGAGSTRHLDALLEIPEIRVIQYTPGAGSPSAIAWLEMFRKIQRKGRSLLIFSPVEEVLPLIDSLSPEGLAVLVEGPASIGQLQELQDQLQSRFGKDKS